MWWLVAGLLYIPMVVVAALAIGALLGRENKVLQMEVEIDAQALAAMQEHGGDWYAYQNHALDSANVGHLQFLKCGEDCTYQVPPSTYPMDNAHGMGWRYVLVGKVNIYNGEVTPVEV